MIGCYFPVPESGTEFGELAALLVMTSDPVNSVADVGAKRTFTVQFLPGKIGAPQLWLATVKVVEPEIVSERMVRLLVPVLVILTDFVELPPTPMLL